MYSYTGVTNTFQIIHIVTFLQDPKLPKGRAEMTIWEAHIGRRQGPK